MTRRQHLWLGGVALIGALGGIVSDNLLMVPHAAPLPPVDVADTWGFFQALMQRVDPQRMAWGHHLGMYAIPLCLLGFWQIADAIRGAGQRWWLAVLGSSHALLIVGVIYHVQLVYIGHGLRLIAESPAQTRTLADMNAWFTLYLMPTQWVITALVLITSITIAGAILTGRTRYPRAAAALSPLTLLAVFYGVAQAVGGELGVRLAVSALNLASAVVFIASTALLARAEEQPERA